LSNIAKCETSIDSSKVLVEQYSCESPDESEISSLRGEVSDIKASKSFIEKKIALEESKDISIGDCEYCGTEVCERNLPHLNKKREEKILSLKEERAIFLEKLKAKMSDLKNLEEQSRRFKMFEKEKEKISFLKDKLESFTSENESLSVDMSEISFKISEAKTKVSILEEKISSLKDSSYEDSEKKLKRKKDLLESLRNQSLELKKRIGVSEANIERYSERLEKLSETKDLLSAKQKEISDYQYLKNVFGKNGIQTILLENVIKNHQHIANEVLKDICNEPIQIHLDTQKDSSDGSKTLETLDLKIRKDGNVLDYDLLSGGEKFRISLSLALGLRELAARFGGTNLNLIMLDEVNSPLDRYGVETLFVSVIEKISNRYKTMVITHDESLKERFDYVIDVTKVNGISSINLNTSS